MNNNFEQQFLQNIQSSSPSGQPVSSRRPTPPEQPTLQPATPTQNITPPKTISYKIFIITTAVLITLIIILIIAITVVSVSSIQGKSEYELAVEDEGDDSDSFSEEEDAKLLDEINEDSIQVIGEDGEISAIYGPCTSEDGTEYYFNKDNTFTKKSSASEASDSGTYTITRSAIIKLSTSDDIFFYDGTIFTNGTEIYNCEL